MTEADHSQFDTMTMPGFTGRQHDIPKAIAAEIGELSPGWGEIAAEVAASALKGDWEIIMQCGMKFPAVFRNVIIVTAAHAGKTARWMENGALWIGDVKPEPEEGEEPQPEPQGGPEDDDEGNIHTPEGRAKLAKVIAKLGVDPSNPVYDLTTTWGQTNLAGLFLMDAFGVALHPHGDKASDIIELGGVLKRCHRVGLKLLTITALRGLRDNLREGAKRRFQEKKAAGAEEEWKGPPTTGLIRAEILEAHSTGTGPVWRREIAISLRGAIEPNIANASLIIRHDTRLSKVFRLNDLDQEIWITRQPPWESGAGWHPHRVEDTDAIAATGYLQMQVNPKITKAIVQDAIDAAGASDSFNPVSDYLAECRAKWDGKRRIGKFATGYLGAKATTFSEKKLFALIGRMFLISAVARALRPGCKVDHVPLLMGKQGLRKSTAIRVLCPDPKWFSDSLPPRLDHKDAMQHLLGTWIIEIAEFDLYKGRSAQELKAFLSKSDDKFRPPYRRREITVGRRCVFAATANPGDPLHDLTGGRRYWPVPIETIIDTARIATDRDQLWGEAVAAFEAGELWHIDETKHAKVVADLVARQEAATAPDPWEPTIAAWLDLPNRIEVSGYGPHAPAEPIYGPHERAGPGNSTYICDVIRFALALPKDRQTQAVSSRVAQILNRLGWARSETRHKVKWYRWDRKKP